MADGASVRRLYAVLGLTPSATDDALKQAYRAAALKWHPDRHTPGTLSHRDADAKFSEASSAFEQLVAHRKQYGAAPRANSGSSGQQQRSGPSGGGAETGGWAHDIRRGQRAADGGGAWTSARGSTWSQQQQKRRPFEYTREHATGFTAPRYARATGPLEYERRYSATEFRVRRFAVAGVLLGGAWMLLTMLTGDGIRRRRLTPRIREVEDVPAAAAEAATARALAGAAPAPVAAPIAVAEAAAGSAAAAAVGLASALDSPPPPPVASEPPMRGRARAPGLAGYKDAGERRYSSSCTAGTSGGRPGKASPRTRDDLSAAGRAAVLAAQQNAAADAATGAVWAGKSDGAQKTSSQKGKRKGGLRRSAAAGKGRATGKSGGLPRETHRVKLIPTQHWDLYGTGANAPHRARAMDAKARATAAAADGAERKALVPEKEPPPAVRFGERMLAPHQNLSVPR